MYLRFARRRKDGKEHRYWSIVESKRCAGGRVVQRPVLYLGEINDGQHAAWCRIIEGFDEGSGQHRQLALFPAERAVPDHAKGFGVQVRLDAMELHPAHPPRCDQIPIARGALPTSTSEGSFPGGVRTTAPVPVEPSRWAVVRNPSQGQTRETRIWHARKRPSFRLDAKLLDERPPFLDLGLLECAERLRRLLLAQENLIPDIGKPSWHRRIG